MNKNNKHNPEVEKTHGSHVGKGNERGQRPHEKAAHGEESVRKEEPKGRHEELKKNRPENNERSKKK
ncbi:MAG: hypothetical protein AB7F19_02810 [Candidatus Babeliales bacterium]